MKNHKPAISVIVPVYNTGDRLRSCVDSILQQTLTDLEIILVDDGSDDLATLALLDEYPAIDDRIRLIRKANGGQSSARNTGLFEARGRYIAFVDHDDVINRHMYEVLYGPARKDDFDVVECRYQPLPYALMEKIDLDVRPSAAPRRIKIKVDKDFLVGNIQVWKRICRRDFLLENNLLFDDLSWEEDVSFSFKVLVSAEMIGYVDAVLYFHVTHPDNTTHKLGERIFDAFKAHNIIFDFLNEKGCIDLFKDQYSGRVLKDVLLNLNVVHHSCEKRFFMFAHERIADMSLENCRRFYSRSKKKLLRLVQEGDYDAFKRYQSIRNFRRSIVKSVMNPGKVLHIRGYPSP
ncbi:MAG: glycosyltransferase [Desulfobacterales bacterium]